jgi:L-alanine-DL-glutamate epimerase-like enolase superfamily enzyme
MKITRVGAKGYRLPLRERMVSSRVTMTHRELVLVEIDTDAGVSGTGWLTTAGVGAMAAKALVDAYLAPTLIGDDPRNTERLWRRLWMECHAAGPAGITTLALSALDIAFWDIKAKAVGEPLHRLLGGARSSVPVYASAINLHLTREQLLDQVRSHMALGYTAFKLKVGKPDMYEDLDRCRAVRELIGPTGTLMLDANQKWGVGEAIQRCGCWRRPPRSSSRSRSFPTTCTATASCATRRACRSPWASSSATASSSGTMCATTRPTSSSPTYGRSAASRNT